MEKRSNDKVLLNRDLFVNMARENDLVVMNTQFDKPDEKLISHRIPGTKSLAQVDAEKFATTDHILGYRWQRNIYKNVETWTDIAFP